VTDKAYARHTVSFFDRETEANEGE
jgi:hypothetical protein